MTLQIEWLASGAQGTVIDFSTNGGTVSIEVKCHGYGIPDHAQDKVFDKFSSSAHPYSRKTHGVGLSFVREIASLPHRRIELVNAAGGGAVATLTLPMASV